MDLFSDVFGANWGKYGMDLFSDVFGANMVWTCLVMCLGQICVFRVFGANMVWTCLVMCLGQIWYGLV